MFWNCLQAVCNPLPADTEAKLIFFSADVYFCCSIAARLVKELT
jgi:hypothetical protein